MAREEAARAPTWPDWEAAHTALGSTPAGSEAEGRRRNAVPRRAAMWTPIPSSPDMDRDNSRLILPLHLVSGVLC